MIKVILITGRSLDQGVSKELGKFSKEYMEKVAVCELDPEDLKLLGVSPGQNVKVKTKYGEVVVKATESTQAPHKGIAFIPYGPWASILMPSVTESTGMPSLKGIEATIEPATDKEILDPEKLIKMVVGREP